jgi:Uma2 family endonuclease
MSAIAAPHAPTGTTTPPPAGAGPRPWKWTREQYYKLGECGFFDGKRVELIRGEIVEMSPINIAHARGVGFVSDAMALVFALGHYINVQQPFSVPSAAPGSEPQPDVAVIPGSRRTASDHPTQAALVVEVADATLFYDTTTKAELYATAGVPEYWMVDLNARELHVFRDPQPLPLPTELAATAYKTHLTLGPSDSVSPLAAPGAAVRVADLLP